MSVSSFFIMRILRLSSIYYPFLWVWLLILLGMVLKPLYLFFLLDFIPNSDNIFYKISLKEYISYAFDSLIYYYIVFFSALFFSKVRRVKALPYNNKKELSNIKLLLIVVILAGVVLIFVDLNLSKQALVTTDLSTYKSNTLINLVMFFSLPLSIAAIQSYADKGKSFTSLLIIVFSILIFTYYTYITGSRGPLLFFGISIFIAISFFFKERRFYWFFTLFLMVLIAGLGSTSNRYNSPLDGNVQESALLLLNSLLTSRNFIDISKNAHIIDYYTDAEFTYGVEVFETFELLIPRALYPSKSVVSVDTNIGQLVYGCEYYGACAVPPGVFTESFMSFGRFGQVFSIVMVVFLITYFFRAFLRYQHSRSFLNIYFSLLIFVPFHVISSGYTSTMRFAFPALFLYFFIFKPFIYFRSSRA
jgi:hypothetical protein